ncbi:hypothetical protein GCM10017786_48020 [Amycolatopsis deserti]|uniref:Uncharacterized protein n=1 Tax=Amycolatopsis deserti TaxID=185696 RepID=A0ABQ3J8B1_9PSEU|nr:hypothetical protein [Amycolatopsis deserti]GHF08616.1 hypothetical protein GCM10017786_48020 [Amycolatopsis deserti]
MTGTMTRTRRDASGFALTAGVVGAAANVLLILFFASGEAWRDVPGPLAWTGPVNDVLVALQFAALVPVAIALGTRAAVVGLTAMTGVVVLQSLLLAEVLEFETQVWWVSGCFGFVFAWVLLVSRRLPRTVRRCGTVVGAGYVAGALLVWGALGLPSESPAQYAVGGLGLVLGAIGWLGLPVWSLLLARGSRR